MGKYDADTGIDIILTLYLPSIEKRFCYNVYRPANGLYDFFNAQWYSLDTCWHVHRFYNHKNRTAMKKVIVSILMIGSLAIPASAKMKSRATKANGQVPYALNPNIDHSKDVAYSSQWEGQAQSPAPDAEFRLGVAQAQYTSPALRGKTYSYSLNNYTLYGSYPVSMNAPYLGMDAPSYDGAARNAYRNMRANNESEPLPANDGK
jgi:hypothetical protein